MLMIAVDDSTVWGDVEIDVLDFLVAFTDEAKDEDIFPFYQIIQDLLMDRLFNILKGENHLTIQRALQIISNLLALVDESYMDMCEDRGFPGILFDLLESNNREIQSIIYTVLFNVFISDTNLLREFMSDMQVLTWLIDRFISSPNSSADPLKCLKTLFNNFEAPCVEEFVRDNPEIVEYFLSKVSLDLKEEVMMLICSTVRSLIDHGDNAIENQLLMANPIKEYILNSQDLLEKLTEGQRHKSEAVNQSFLRIVTEHFTLQEGEFY